MLVAENPLEDIRRMADKRGVMVDGRWYSRQELARLREEIATTYRAVR